MDSDPQMERKAHLNKLLVYAVIGVVVVVVYFVFLLISRHQAAREFEQRNTEMLNQQHRAEDQLTFNSSVAQGSASALFTLIPRLSGAGNPHRSAMTSSTRRPSASIRLWRKFGHRTRGVSGSRPKRTTTYTLTVTDANGKTATNNVEVKVR